MDSKTVYQKETVWNPPNAQNSSSGKFLIIIDTNGKVQEISLDKMGRTRIFMGRVPGTNDIVIPSSIISSSHGKFKIDNGKLYYADLNSTNGTILEVDGYQRRIRGNQQYCELHSGNMLRIQPEQSTADNSVLILYMDGTEDGVWRKFPILASKAKIGRDMDNDIVVQHPGVSRVHALLEKKGDQMVLIDNNSINGTIVNGYRLTGSRVLQEKDVIRILNSTLIYTNGTIYYKNSAQGITIEVNDMNKYVGRNKKQILNHVNCRIESNEFVAIIGGSGAGKSTLMNAISGFDKKVQGRVSFNGTDLRSHFNELKSLIGYVPQEDIIYENLTLRKMLYYTAKLKMPGDTSKKEIESRINQVLSMVELSAHQNTFIRKLSGGQKKRASIAVEMLADPSVFFLDEPTSGLDPGTEQKLMITLNKLSKAQGKTIIMVTHTTQSLDLCDKVIFMGRGGRLCFCGTTEQAKMFFDTDNLVDIYNMITDDAEFWQEQYRNCMMDEERNAAPPKQQPIGKKKHSMMIGQLPVLITRYVALIKNDFQRLSMLFLQPLLIALLLTIVANEDAFVTHSDTKSIMFALSCAGIWIGLFNSIQEICKERAILKREYMGNLKLPFYILSKFLVQTILGALQALLLSGVFCLIVGKPDEGILVEFSYLEIFLTIWITIEASMALGFVISALVKSGDKAMTLAPFVLIIQLLFSGILFELDGAGEYIANITISKWSVGALGSISDLNNLESQFPIEAKDIFEHAAAHLWTTWGIMLIMTLVCAILCNIFLLSLSRDGR